MTRAWLVFALLLLPWTGKASNGTVNLMEVRRLLGTMDEKRVVETLDRAGKFDAVLRKIATGNKPWVEIADLHQFSLAATSLAQ